eukprot:524128_1
MTSVFVLLFVFLRLNIIIDAETIPNYHGLYVEEGVSYTELHAESPSNVSFIYNNTANRYIIIEINGGRGDADMYIKYGAKPVLLGANYDCGPYEDGSNETCYFTAQIGPYYILLEPYHNFTDVTLTITGFKAYGPNCTMGLDDVYVCKCRYCRDTNITCLDYFDCHIVCNEFESCHSASISWPNNGTGSIECIGDYSCYDIEFPQPPAYDDFEFVCDEFQCEYSTIYCPTNADCSILCDGSDACRYSTIYCPTNADCSILCDGWYACRYSIVYCPIAIDKSCNITCTDEQSCSFQKINSPPNGTLSLNCLGPHSCLFSSVSMPSPYDDFKFVCDSGQGCWGIHIICPLYANCDITCSDFQACKESTFICPLFGNCNITCKGGTQACKDTTIAWSSHLVVSTLNCDYGLMNACEGVTPQPELHKYTFNGVYDL